MPQEQGHWSESLLAPDPEEQQPKHWSEGLLAGPDAPEATAGEYAQQAASSLVRGVAEMPAGVIDAVGILGELNSMLRWEGGGRKIREKSHEYAQAVRQFAQDVIPPVEKLEDNFWVTDVPMGIGSAAGFLAGGAAGMAAKIPSVFTTMGLGAAINGSAGFYDTLYTSEKHGLDPNSPEVQRNAWLSFTLNAGAGLTEALPISRMLNRWDKGTGGAVRRVLVDAAIEGGEEAIQEGFQTVFGNLVHNVTTPEDVVWYENLVRSGGAGALAGVFLSALVSGAGRMRRAQEGLDAPLGEDVTQPEAQAEQPEVPAEALTADEEAQIEIDAAPTTPMEVLVQQGALLGVPDEVFGEARARLEGAQDQEAELNTILEEWTGAPEEEKPRVPVIPEPGEKPPVPVIPPMEEAAQAEPEVQEPETAVPQEPQEAPQAQQPEEVPEAAPEEKPQEAAAEPQEVRPLKAVQAERHTIQTKIDALNKTRQETQKALNRTKKYGKPTKRRQELLNRLESTLAALKEQEAKLGPLDVEEAEASVQAEEAAVEKETSPLRKLAKEAFLDRSSSRLSPERRRALEGRAEAATAKLQEHVDSVFSGDLKIEPPEGDLSSTGSAQWVRAQLQTWLATGSTHSPIIDRHMAKARGGNITKMVRQMRQAAIEQKRHDARTKTVSEAANLLRSAAMLHEAIQIEEYARKNGLTSDQAKYDKEVEDWLKKTVEPLVKRAKAKNAEKTLEGRRKKAQPELNEVETLKSLAPFEEHIKKNSYRPSEAWHGNMADEGSEYATDGRVLVLKSAMQRDAGKKTYTKRNEAGRGVSDKGIEQVRKRANDTASVTGTLIGVVEHEGMKAAVYSVPRSLREQVEGQPAHGLRFLNADIVQMLTRDFGIGGKLDFTFGQNASDPAIIGNSEGEVGVIMPLSYENSEWVARLKEAVQSSRDPQAAAADWEQEILKHYDLIESVEVVEDDADIDDIETHGSPHDIAESPARMRGHVIVDPIHGGGLVASSPIGADLEGALEAPPKPPKGAGKVNAPGIIYQLSKIIAAAGGKTPILFGRMGNSKALGHFEVQPEVIRVRVANDIATAIHEVGHALEKHIYGWKKGGPWKKPIVGRKIQQELVKLGKLLYGKTKPAAGYKREGFAEFMRLYLTRPEHAKQSAPLFYDWFESDFLGQAPDTRRKVFSQLKKAREMVKVWGDMGSLERARASMIDPTSLKQRSLRSRVALMRHFSIEAWIETGKSLFEYAREAERRLGRKLRPSEDPYFAMSAWRTGHAGKVAYMVDEGMIDIAGNKVGPSLMEIRPLIKGKYRDFSIYLWAKRAVALWTDPNGPRGENGELLGRHPGLSLEDAQQIASELQSDNFDLAASKLYDWNEGILNYAAQASPTFAEVVDRIRQADPGYYIPLQREFEEMDKVWAELRSRGVGAATGASFVKKLRGSGRRIKDPIAALISNANRTVMLAHQRFVIDQVLKLSRIEGMGYLLRKVPKSRKPVAEVTIGDLVKQINKKAIDATGDVFVDLETSGLDATDFISETITFFAPNNVAPPGTIPIYNPATKKVELYEAHPRLMRTLAGMDVYRLPRALEMVFGIPASLFRAGTTGLRASFAFITNPTRDIQTIWRNTRSGAWAPRLFAEYLKNLTQMAVHLATGRKYKPPLYDAFRRLGVEMAQPLGQDIGHTARSARRLAHGPIARIINPNNIYDFIRDLFQIPEGTGRMAEIKLVGEQVGWKPGDQMTLDQSLKITLAAKQVSTDFTAGGEYSRVMNRIAPFHTAAWQGPRASIRAAKHHPARYLFRGLETTAMTLALWWWNKDKDWYIELSDRVKALYWAIPFHWQGREEVAIIPRDFEAGMIFAALPEMLMDAWYRQEPEQAGVWVDQFFKLAIPPGLPPLGTVAVEQMMNKSLFWDTPIVPESVRRLPPEEQFTDYTSDAARFIGEMFKVSPRRVDHAIRGVFGGVGADLVSLTVQKPRNELSDTFLIGKLFQRGGGLGYHPKTIDKFYDMLGDYELRYRSKRQHETEKQRQTRLMLSDAAKGISALSTVRTYTDDPDKRRKLAKQALEYAHKALELEKKGVMSEAARDYFKEFRKLAEKLEERTPRRRE